jgi:putative transposase
MPHAMTQSFSAELPLVLVGGGERTLLVRLDCARQVYNAVLGESLKRLALLRQSKAYQATRRLRLLRDRGNAFRTLEQTFKLREYDLCAYANRLCRTWLGQHLDAHSIQAIASRAWRAVRQYQLGKRGRPRFKGKGQIDTVQGKNNRQGIRWRDGKVVWNGLCLAAHIDPSDLVIAYALACRIKYVRIVRRKLNGRNRFFAQLICEGAPYRDPKHSTGSGTIGIDPGPRTFGVAGADWGAQIDLSTPLKASWRERRRLQRHIDRQRQANNPDNYLPDGRTRPGPKVWRRSRKQQANEQQLAEAQRREAAHRTSLHGQLANALLSLGDDIRVEKNSYRSFQKTFGKAVGQAAPATFVSRLAHKAASADAQVLIIPASLRLSQTCLCGVVARKSLAERIHRCACGLTVQRDVFAAYLARFVQTMDGPSGPSWWLDADQAKAAWPGAESHLPAASSPVSVPAFVAWARQQSASGRSPENACLPFLHGEPERIAGKGGTMICESRDVVNHSVHATSVVESQAERIWLSSEPPRSTRGEETQEHPHRGSRRAS